MAISYNYKNVVHNEFFEHPTDPTKEHPWLETLTYATIYVGIPEITEANYELFARRFWEVKKIYGDTFCDWMPHLDTWPSGRRKGMSYSLSDPVITKKLIGFKTGASKFTEKQFQADLAQRRKNNT